ncbi:MAG TPA: hypothetical protein VIS48_05175 [Candidatus Kryptonia bacterium]
MYLKHHKAVAKTILVLYVLITATFSLDHKDFVPLEGQLDFNSQPGSHHVVDANDFELTCPAHNFAQSTTGTPAISHEFISRTEVSFFPTGRISRHFSEPTRSYSTRAPPQA